MSDNILLNADNGVIGGGVRDESDPALVPDKPDPGSWSPGFHSQKQQRLVQIPAEGRKIESESVPSLSLLHLHVPFHRHDMIQCPHITSSTTEQLFTIHILSLT